MNKRLFLLFFLMILLPLCAFAEQLGFMVYPALVRPGKTDRISFSAPSSGSARLELLTASGEPFGVIRENVSVLEGTNHLTWDGTISGAAVSAGEYLLSLSLNGETARQPVTVGAISPQILAVQAADHLQAGESWRLTVKTNMAGRLAVSLRLSDGGWIVIIEEDVSEGQNSLRWDGLYDLKPLSAGSYAVQLKLTDEEGFTGTVQQVSLVIGAVPTPTPAPTPAPAPTPRVIIPSAVTTREDETNYWTLPVGVMDEAAIWEIMTQPIIVIDSSKVNGKSEKDVYQLRKTPDAKISKDTVVGEITYDSQGVHILETLDNGWTLVEAFNSSYGPNCASRVGYGVTDDLIRGYVKTSLLKTITPRTDYGLLVDKLEQRMYIFSDGKCIGTLLVSTGLNNAKQSWNETPSGEFLMVSRMGGFPAGNLWCAYGMRVNGGCAMHEVPYIGNEDTPPSQRDYSSTVKMLGKKASHGCIRIQKAANENGQNIKWLWDNIKLNTKVLIWDDTGRFTEYPPDDTPIYYNPVGGKYYHEDQYCSSVKSTYLPLKAITYQQLNEDSAFSKLTPCSHCAQIMKKTEIDAINKANGF